MVLYSTAARLSPQEYLAHFTPSVFPTYFETALHPFFGSILDYDTEMRVAAVKSQFDDLRRRMSQTEGAGGIVRRASGQQARCPPV